jgi:hypothetical protein
MDSSIVKYLTKALSSVDIEVLLNDDIRLKSILKDFCPSLNKEISVIISFQINHFAIELYKKDKYISELDFIKFSERFASITGYERKTAEWGMHIWCNALNKNLDFGMSELNSSPSIVVKNTKFLKSIFVSVLLIISIFSFFLIKHTKIVKRNYVLYYKDLNGKYYGFFEDDKNNKNVLFFEVIQKPFDSTQYIINLKYNKVKQSAIGEMSLNINNNTINSILMGEGIVFKDTLRNKITLVSSIQNKAKWKFEK